jgi:hypothetical protein
LDGVDDGGQTGLREDDVSGATGSIGGTFDGDSDVGAGQSGGVVGTVTYKRVSTSVRSSKDVKYENTHQS